MEQFQQDQLSDLDLQVDSEVRQHLYTSSKWGKFISITVFIFCSISLVALLAGSTFISLTFKKMYGRIFAYVFENYFWIIIAIIVLVPATLIFIHYFLFSSAAKIKSALLNEDSNTLNRGLNLLKSYFIITTILSIVVLLANIYGLFK